jgi:hypothetical protein
MLIILCRKIVCGVLNIISYNYNVTERLIIGHHYKPRYIVAFTSYILAVPTYLVSYDMCWRTFLLWYLMLLMVSTFVARRSMR